MRIKAFGLAILMMCLILAGCSAPQVAAGGESTEAGHRTQGTTALQGSSEPLEPEELEAHPLFSHFSDAHDSVPLITGIAGDCNGDGVEDLTLVFRHSEAGNHLVTVYSAGNEYRISEEISAPVEDCLLKWRDIDEVPPVELLVSGRKGIHIGYAIYRFEEGAWIALFGDGMGDCC